MRNLSRKSQVLPIVSKEKESLYLRHVVAVLVVIVVHVGEYT